MLLCKWIGGNNIQEQQKQQRKAEIYTNRTVAVTD